ncbi:hypothetical protein OXX59_000876 [Metschnikowia pulcherrima]
MTSIDSLPGLSPTREYTVIIICSAQTAYDTSIRYVSEGSHDIYVISRVYSFFTYLEKLVEQMTNVPKARLILVNHNMNVLVDVLRLITRKSPTELTKLQRDKYIMSYKENMLKSSGTASDLGSDFHVTLPSGHADVTSGFDLAIIQDCAEIDDINHISEKNVFTQQALRFMALKHGARFAAVSGFQDLIQNAVTMISLTNRLFQNSHGTTLVVYKAEGIPFTEIASIHQYIPVGWDSWSKVILVAKSIPQFSKYKKLLTMDVHLEELNDAYDEYFRASTQAPDVNSKSESTAESRLSQGGIYGTDEIYQEGKKQLSQLLAVDPSLQPPPPKKDTRVSYADFLQKLAAGMSNSEADS